MPQVVAAVAAFAGSTALAAGASAATAMVVANTVGWLMTYVVPTFLVSTISRAIQKRPTLPSLKALGMEVNVRDAAAPRSIIYGQRRVSGVLYPVGTSGTNNEYLHLLVLIAGHEVEELGAVYFNDEEVPLDGSGNATGKYAGYARVKKHLGTYNQTVDTDLQTDLGSGTWSNNHKLAGIAYLYIRLKQSPDLFAGIPEFFCLVKGRKVFDPRDGTQVAGTYSTWKWSSNAALCLADWVRGVPSLNGSGTLVRNYGVGASDAEMDYTALTTAANICDETVALSTSLTKTCDVASGNRHIGCAAVSGIVPGLKVAGTGIPTGTTVVSVDESGTFFTVDRDPTATNNGVTLTIGSSESRYQAHGTLASSVRAGDGIDAIKSAMAGDCVYVGGQWLILAGAYRTPTVTLTESDLRASLTGVRLKPTRREIVNVVKGVFVSPANAWQPSDFPPVRNATYKTQDGGEDLPADIELPFTTSSSCAQRLAKIMLERSRQGIAFTAKCKLTAMQVQVGDVVRFTNARFGWSAKPFEVLGFSFNAENDPSGAPYLGVDLTLKETASGVWDWNSGEETTIDLAPNTDLPDAFTVPTPAGLTLTSGSGVALQQTDGTILNRLKVAWTAPSNAYVTNGGLVWIEYKQTADTDWITWSNATRGDQTVDYILDVKVGVSYDVRVRFENQLGVRGSYATVTGHTVGGNAITPETPTAATKTASGFYTGGDGTVFSYLTISVPALPTGAAKQFLVYKRSTDTDWLVAAGPLTNTASAVTVTINDLTPGVIYAVATLALSALDKPSSYVDATSSPFTAPSKNTNSDVPASVTYTAGNASTFGEPARFGAVGVQYMAKVTWAIPSGKDVKRWQWVTTFTDTDAAADTAANPVGPGLQPNYVEEAKVVISADAQLLGTPLYFRVRSINDSGVASAWAGGGTDLWVSHMKKPAGVGDASAKNVGTTAGTVAAGDDSRITGAAQKSSNLSDLSSVATARTNLGVTATGSDTTYAYRSNNLSDLNSAATALINLGVRSSQFVADVGTGGGNTTFKATFTHNFGFEFEKVIAACTTDANVMVKLDYNDAANDTNNSVFVFTKVDGTNFNNNNLFRVTAVFLK